MSLFKRKKKKNIATQSVVGGTVGFMLELVLFAVIIMLVYRLSNSAYEYGQRIFGEPAMTAAPGREIEIVIKDGEDFEGIAELFYDKGLVRDEKLFLLQEKLSNYAKDGFKPGSYTLTTAMTPDEMLDIIGQGNGEE